MRDDQYKEGARLLEERAFTTAEQAYTAAGDIYSSILAGLGRQPYEDPFTTGRYCETDIVGAWRLCRNN